MKAHTVARIALGVLAWSLVAGLPARCQEPVAAADIAAEIGEFYDGVDDAAKDFLRQALGRGIGPGRFTTEGALEQVPKEQLADQRARWLALVEGDRYEAIENLGAAHCVQAVPALLRIATAREAGDQKARWLAVRALGRIGDERAIPELVYLVNYFEENTRMWARASLYRLTGQWFGGDREAWGNWWNQTGGEPRYVPEERYPVAQALPFDTPGGFVVLGGGVAGNGKRAWGPEQAAGEPDTFQAGDIVTAWASLTPDASPEWLQLDYENAVVVAGVNVRETYCPGAVCKVTALVGEAGGELGEVVLWEGQDPTREAPGVFAVPVQGEVTAQRIKVYLDSPAVSGWNEIDAVELVGKDGTHQWAKQASASSTYAERGGRRGLQRLTTLAPMATRREIDVGPAAAAPASPLPVRVPPDVGFHREGAFYWNDFEDPATAGRGWSRQEMFALPAPGAFVLETEIVLPNTLEGGTVRKQVAPLVDSKPMLDTRGTPTATTLLGRFGNEPVSLTLEGLPPHRFVQIAFEFYALSSWDGDQTFMGPDLWTARVEDGPRLVWASFGPPHNDSPTQSFPLPFGLGGMPPGSGGHRVSAPIPFNDGRSPTWSQHYVYPMCFTVPHSAATLRVWFTGLGLQGLDDESWALDNVGVALLDECPAHELTPEQLQQAWNALAVAGAAEAWEALLALTGARGQAAAFLVERLGLQPDGNLRQRVEDLAAAFEHDDPDPWQEAAEEMQHLPPQALPLAWSRVDRRRYGPNPPTALLRELVDRGALVVEADLELLRQRRAVYALELLWTEAARSALLFE